MMSIQSSRSLQTQTRLTVDQVVRFLLFACILLSASTTASKWPSPSFSVDTNSLAFQRSNLFTSARSRSKNVQGKDRFPIAVPSKLLNRKMNFKNMPSFWSQKVKLPALTSTIPISGAALASTLPWVLRGGAGAAVTLEAFFTSIASSKAKCWVLLLTMIVLESGSTSLSKLARDIGSPPLFLMACGLYILCMAGFNVCLSQIEVGVAYAVWSAMGTLLVTTLGVLFFGEKLNFVKVFCLSLIVAGVLGLNLYGGSKS